MKKSQMAITFLPFFIMVINFSCNDQISSIPVSTISDNRLNGLFSYHDEWETPSSKKYIKESYLFDGSTKVFYHHETGYITGYDVHKNDSNFELEIDNGKYRFRSFGSVAAFSEWFDIYFNFDNTKLYLKDTWYYKSNK